MAEGSPYRESRVAERVQELIRYALTPEYLEFAADAAGDMEEAV